MKRVIIGHRGVGKSSLLMRHQTYFTDRDHFDLDLEIEKKANKKISDIFFNEGEKIFRQLELETFQQLIQKDAFVISVGGGFPVEQIPQDIEVVFVSRRTDSDGRIFLNRPTINSTLSPLEDSLQLYKNRQQKFIDRADLIYLMPEGIKNIDSIEKQILSKIPFDVLSYTTVAKNNAFESLNQNLELRTDLLSAEKIQKIVEKNPQKNFLISYRTPESQFSFSSEKIIYDWGLELGLPSKDFLNQKNIISVHEGSIENCINQLEAFSECHLKLSPVIHSWRELIQGYRWQQVNPNKRSFLPRTIDTKFNLSWFRLLSLSWQKINFVYGFTQLPDQPSLYEILNFKKNYNKKEFGAVLGWPVAHSRTPQEQQPHMSMPILSISVEEKEFSLAISFLTELGLRFAAVTSPLKKVAGSLCALSEECNSLVYKNQKWFGTSTDHFGFEKLWQHIPSELQSAVAVWGGAGVISSLKKIAPHVQWYSARTGKLKNDIKNNSKAESPQVVIWAAPRHPEIRFPDQIYTEWKPQMILDLNYVDHSMGLEYAKRINIQYISGLEMFFEQARQQRIFWKEAL